MERLEKKLATLLEEKKTYEAQQLAVTVFHRKLGKDKAGAERVVVETAVSLVKLDDEASALALVNVWCQRLKKELDVGLAEQLLKGFETGEGLDKCAAMLVRQGDALRQKVALVYFVRKEMLKAQVSES